MNSVPSSRIMTTRLVFTAITAAAVVALAPSAKAQLLVYEGFNYTAGSQMIGTTADGSGGTGWSTTWSTTSANIATNTAGSMSYGSLATSGGSVINGNLFGPTANGNVQRLVPNSFGVLAAGGSGTLWMSFLYQNLGGDLGGLSGFRQANIGFFSGST